MSCKTRHVKLVETLATSLLRLPLALSCHYPFSFAEVHTPALFFFQFVCFGLSVNTKREWGNVRGDQSKNVSRSIPRLFPFETCRHGTRLSRRPERKKRVVRPYYVVENITSIWKARPRWRCLESSLATNPTSEE